MFSLWHRNAIDLIRFLQDRAAVVNYSYSFGIRHWPPGDSCILFFNLAPCVYTFEHFSSEDFGIWNWNEAYKILLVANQSSWLYNYSAGQNEGLLYNPLNWFKCRSFAALNWFKCRSFAALNWFKCRCHYILNLKTSFLMKVVCCSADWTLATTYMMNQKSNFCNSSPPPPVFHAAISLLRNCLRYICEFLFEETWHFKKLFESFPNLDVDMSLCSFSLTKGQRSKR